MRKDNLHKHVFFHSFLKFILYGLKPLALWMQVVYKSILQIHHFTLDDLKMNMKMTENLTRSPCPIVPFDQVRLSVGYLFQFFLPIFPWISCQGFRIPLPLNWNDFTKYFDGMDLIFFLLALIFKIHHLFIKGYVCITQGS